MGDLAINRRGKRSGRGEIAWSTKATTYLGNENGEARENLEIMGV